MATASMWPRASLPHPRRAPPSSPRPISSRPAWCSAWARRLELIGWARASSAWIVEDDYASEFRYGGRPLAALQGLDRGQRTIYVGTLNKALFPGLRAG